MEFSENLFAAEILSLPHLLAVDAPGNAGRGIAGRGLTGDVQQGALLVLSLQSGQLWGGQRTL